MDKKIKLDGGTIEERIDETKRFFGLKPEQSFQELDIDDLKTEKQQKQK